MFFRRFFLFALVGLLLFGLLGSRARAEYDRGYTHGYTAGLQAGDAADGEAAAPAPLPPADHARPGWGWGFLPFVGFLGFFLPFLLILFGLKLVFGRGRRWHHRHGDGPWGRGRHAGKRHGPWGDPKSPREKQPEDVEPEIRHA